MLDRREILLAGAGALFAPSAGLAQKAAAPEAVGSVASIKGEANARRAGQARTLQPGEALFVNERLQTASASRLQAALGPATNLLMGENTHIMIDRHLVRRGGTIHLAQGGILFARKAPDPKPAVTISSPYAMLAVRGTTVFAGPSNGVFGVFVEEGLVIVRNKGGTVTLRPGEGTDIARHGARPTPAARWGKARIDAALASVR